jgi:hypothetical protein
MSQNMRITVILEEDQGETFAAYCQKMGFKKSTLIKRLIREHIENEGFQHQKNLFDEKANQGGINEGQN